MLFWKKQEPFERTRRETIAKIDGRYVRDDAVGPIFFLILGLIAMVFILILENSAVRLAAWAALWTGYNVFCAAFMVNKGGTFLYTVYREVPRSDPPIQ